MKKILYVSGSIGLGHVPRDLAIVREMRKLSGNIDILWLAAPPAVDVLKEAGEKLLPECEFYRNENISAESASKGFHLNIVQFSLKAKDAWKQNVDIFMNIVEKQSFHMVIGDETYEIITALKKHPDRKSFKFVIIYNFIGLDSMSSNIFEKMGVFYWNRIWSKDFRKPTNHYDLGLFVGEPEDVPDRKFGVLLPNRREYAKEKYKFVGYILNFNPEQFLNKEETKQKLGYGPEPLIICSIGGTMIGKELLNLCGKCYPVLQKSLPNIKMVLVCGPRLSPGALQTPTDVEIRTYVPNLYQHFAASDLAVVQGGHSSTIELTALNRPFLFFPLEGHCEQQVYVSSRLARHNAGIRMDIATTTPELLAEKILSNIGKKVKYQTFPVNGAKKAASLIIQHL